MKTDVTVTPQDRKHLEGLIADRNTPAKVVWRAEIVLATADGESVKAICRLRAWNERTENRCAKFRRAHQYSGRDEALGETPQ
jgi:hypothetical protein